MRTTHGEETGQEHEPPVHICKECGVVMISDEQMREHRSIHRKIRLVSINYMLYLY